MGCSVDSPQDCDCVNDGTSMFLKDIIPFCSDTTTSSCCSMVGNDYQSLGYSFTEYNCKAVNKTMSKLFPSNCTPNCPSGQIFYPEIASCVSASYLSTLIEEPMDLYNGQLGPSKWGNMKDFGENQCEGKRQSPINIALNDWAFNTTLSGIFKNNGFFPNVAWTAKSGGVLINAVDTFEYMPNGADGTFVRPDGIYDLIQFYIKSPSEHRVNGRSYAAEFHFVHKKQGSNELAIIGAFVELGEVSDTFTSSFVNAAKNLYKKIAVPFTPNYSFLMEGLKSTPMIYRYTGSLTTPPCTEGVKWHVASKVFLTISPSDYEALKNKMPFNSRMTQPLYYVSDKQWSVARKSDYYV